MKKAQAGLPSSAGQFRLESLLLVFCGYSPIKPGKFFQTRPPLPGYYLETNAWLQGAAGYLSNKKAAHKIALSLKVAQ